jgi:hypothetical protein
LDYKDFCTYFRFDKKCFFLPNFFLHQYLYFVYDYFIQKKSDGKYITLTANELKEILRNFFYIEDKNNQPKTGTKDFLA